MKHFEHIDAFSIEEAARQCADGSVIIAGGTDLLGVLKDKLLPDYPEKLVNIKTIADLSYIKEDEEGLKIGAATKLSEIADSEVVKSSCHTVAEAAESVASPLIRNLATVGGNICQDSRCWYYRYPHQLGGRIECLRKGGEYCAAYTGENRYHSIFGGMRINITACSKKCPANVDIPEYLACVRENNLDKAAEVLLRKNPMPALTSRVCTHFCQIGCHRGEVDNSVTVGQIERFVGDYILEHAENLMTGPEKENGWTVAVVGAGPAGMSAAYYLRKQGYGVVVYDKMEEPGGLLMYAIPQYRLPKEKVRQYVSALKNMGIEFRCNVEIGQEIRLEDLEKDYDRVFLGTGAWKRTVIGVEGEELTTFGLDFLVEVKKWMDKNPGKDVVVVGGGNVAVDVAVTAKRLGASKVTIVSLEGADELPATKEEMERALEEGIEHIPNRGPKEILRSGGKITGIALKKCVSLRDETGAFSPKYDENDVLTIESDSILLAVGQRTDLSFLGANPGIETERGRISIEEASQMTSKPNVFAGGDITTGPATVVAAMAAGRRAAENIKRQDGGTAAACGCMEPEFVKCNRDVCDCEQPVELNILPKEERTIEKEDDQGLGLEEVQKEAGRCFNCGCYAVNSSDVENVLVCLDAVIETNKRRLTAEEFFMRSPKVSNILEADEFVTGIMIPKQKDNVKTVYQKYRDRKSIDFSIASVAGKLEMNGKTVEHAKIILGAVAPVPVRAAEAETYLAGKELTQEVIMQACDYAVAGAQPLPQNAYKTDLVKGLLKKVLVEASR